MRSSTDGSDDTTGAGEDGAVGADELEATVIGEGAAAGGGAGEARPESPPMRSCTAEALSCASRSRRPSMMAGLGGSEMIARAKALDGADWLVDLRSSRVRPTSLDGLCGLDGKAATPVAGGFGGKVLITGAGSSTTEVCAGASLVGAGEGAAV